MKPVPRTSKGSARSDKVNEGLKPNMIVEYNKLKGGIDIADTQQAYHSSERKSIRWYHKIADSLLFGTCVVNASLLFPFLTKSADENLMHLSRFRELIVQDLLGLKPGPDRTAKPTNHYLRKAEGSEGTSGRSPRGRCKGRYDELTKKMSSSEARKQAKRVPTKCANCEDHPFFFMPCFEKAHNKSGDT